jgi:predicted ester cyclase
VKFALGVYGWHHVAHKFAHSRGGEEAVSTEENKALVRRFVDEVQSKGNTDLIDEICSAEFVNHSTPPGLPPDREGIKIVTAMFRAAFPDSYFTVEDMMAEGDKVATRKTFHGTHEGEFMGIPPTGRRVSMGLIDIVRIVDGRVVEHWSMGDNLGMMQQLGGTAQQGERAEPGH